MWNGENMHILNHSWYAKPYLRLGSRLWLCSWNSILYMLQCVRISELIVRITEVVVKKTIEFSFFGGGGHKVKLMPIGTYNIVSRDTMNWVCIGEPNIGGGGGGGGGGAHAPSAPPPVPTPMKILSSTFTLLLKSLNYSHTSHKLHIYQVEKKLHTK